MPAQAEVERVDEERRVVSPEVEAYGDGRLGPDAVYAEVLVS